MPRPRSELTRQSVLSAMRRAISVGTYASVTIEGLAAEAGVSKQTIYRWWGTKAAILGEAMLEGELPGSPPDLPESDDLAADLRAWLAISVDLQERPQQSAVARALIAVTAEDPALGAELNDRFARPVLAWIVRRLERAKASGEVGEGIDSASVAELFLATVSYAALLGRPVTTEHGATLVDTVLEGIRPR